MPSQIDKNASHPHQIAATDGNPDRMEWSRTTILGFIEDYRRQRVLWDPNTKGYHVKHVKYEALKQLGHKYGTEIRSIRSKIKSLRSSFHREHGKVINGQRRGIHYQPMWFAYEAIRFILDGEAHRSIVNDAESDEKRETGRDADEAAERATGERVVNADAEQEQAEEDDGEVESDVGEEEELRNAGCGDSNVVAADGQAVKRGDSDGADMSHYCNISAEDVKTELIESESPDLQGALEKSHSPLSYLSLVALTTSPAKKRKRTPQPESTHRHQHKIEAPPNAKIPHTIGTNRPQETTTTLPNKFGGGQTDEYGVFGEYVAITIRKLKTSKAKIVVKHLINNLLYEAELGKYDYGIPASKEPPQLYKT